MENFKMKTLKKKISKNNSRSSNWRKIRKSFKKLSDCLAENRRLKKKGSYLSTKCRKLKITTDVTLSTKMKDLHDQIKCLKNGKLKLSDKVYDFENNCLMLFKKGQYWNDIRSAYEDLLCIASANVS